MDEAAGEARGKMAAESKARKKKEAAQLAKENDKYETMIENTHSKTDDGDGHQF